MSGFAHCIIGVMTTLPEVSVLDSINCPDREQQFHYLCKCINGHGTYPNAIMEEDTVYADGLLCVIIVPTSNLLSHWHLLTVS